MLEEINPDTKYEVNNNEHGPSVILVRTDRSGEVWREIMPVLVSMAELDDRELNGSQFVSAHIEPMNTDMGYWDRSM